MWDITVMTGQLQRTISWMCNLTALTFKKFNAGFANGDNFTDSNHGNLNGCVCVCCFKHF